MNSLVSVDDLRAGELEWVVRRSWELAEGAQARPVLRGRRCALVFLEPSSRTVLSFSVAIEQLEGHWIRVDSATSSLSKQESLRDTVRVLEAQGFDCLIVRAPWVGTAAIMDRWFKGSVLNAGEGVGEHPSQAVQDASVLAYLRREEGRGLGVFDGLRVAIVGDLRHSRVARSVGRLWARLGAHIVGVAPPTWSLAPEAFGAQGVVDDLDEVIDEVDVVYMLRVQRERLSDRDTVVDQETFRRRFALTAQRLERLAPSVIVMHPGPITRGVEVDDAVVASPHMVDGVQYRFGVPTRVALLEYLCGEDT